MAQDNCKKLIIDEEDFSPENEDSEDINTNEVDNMNLNITIEGCHNCEGFRENADRAWNILGDYRQALQKMKELENENEQLKRINDESRNYIAILRKQEDDLTGLIREKDREIQDLKEERGTSLELELELPPSSSPPTLSKELEEKQNEADLQIQALIPIEKIFKSSFFLEMEKMVLIDDIVNFNIPPEKELLEETGKPQLKIELVPGQPTNLSIHQISKQYGINKTEAALLYAQEKKKIAEKRDSGKRRTEIDSSGEEAPSSSSKKVYNRSSQMPWMPKRTVLPKATKLSVLTREEHRRYVGIIANFLKSIPRLRFDQNMMEIKALDKKLEEERAFYEKNALLMASDFKTAFDFRKQDKPLFMDIQQARIRYYIGDMVFRGKVSSIQWSNESLGAMAPALNFRIHKVLSSGDIKPVSIPSIRDKFLLDMKSLHEITKEKLEKKVKILDDVQMQEYGLTNDVPVLMDASTLRHLLSPTSSNKFRNYACRVTVLRRIFEGVLRNLCIVSPPLIASRPNKIAISQSVAKWTLKANLLYKPDVEQLEGSGRAKKKPKLELEDSCQTLLDQMGLSNIGRVQANQSRKQYAIVNLDDPKLEASPDQKHLVLIRTSPPAKEAATSKLISITGRPEFLPEVGAEKLTNDELIWNMTAGLLKNSDEHLNFRINIPSHKGANAASVLQYSRLCPKDFTRLSQETRQLFSTRIERICRLLEAFKALEAGDYLLVPDIQDETLKIVKEVGSSSVDQEPEDTIVQDNEHFTTEVDENRSTSLWTTDVDGVVYDADWFKYFLKSKLISPSNEIKEYWNGLDPHYTLQWHIVKGQIPGALYPSS